MVRKYDSILGAVGDTPVVRINSLAPDGVNLFVKCEYFNPLSSVKDRLALGVIEAAEKSGDLKPGQTVVEATSGNTGIGLAMVCAAKGYPLVVTMAETFSVERRQLMRFLGAKVVLTPKEHKGTGMVEKAKELSEKHGWFLTRQFENTANPDMHERTTAREIMGAFPGGDLNYWVTGFGTGGTLTGVSRVLRKESPKTKIIVCEPPGAPMLTSGQAQDRQADGSPAGSHPAWTPHPIQGWSPDFVPLVTSEAVDSGAIDEIVLTPHEEGMKWSRELARKEGIFTGISGGSTFAGAMDIANKANKGDTILCMLPDTAERYLTTPLFGDIEAEMDQAERDLSASTPGYQFS